MNVLTNDPSSTEWGWAVVSTVNDEIIEMGCIKTSSESKKRRIRKGDDTVRRISEINSVLIGVIKKHSVRFLTSELPHGSQNASAAKMIGIVAGISQTIADCLELGIEWYSEGDAKKALLDKRSATKQETIDAVSRIWNIDWTGVKYKDEAIADAMAIYNVAIKTSATLKLFRG